MFWSAKYTLHNVSIRVGACRDGQHYREGAGYAMIMEVLRGALSDPDVERAEDIIARPDFGSRVFRLQADLDPQTAIKLTFFNTAEPIN